MRMAQEVESRSFPRSLPRKSTPKREDTRRRCVGPRPAGTGAANPSVGYAYASRRTVPFRSEKIRRKEPR